MSFPKTFDFPPILRHGLSRVAWYCFILFALFVCECVCERLNKTKELARRFPWFCVGIVSLEKNQQGNRKKFQLFRICLLAEPEAKWLHSLTLSSVYPQCFKSVQSPGKIFSLFHKISGWKDRTRDYQNMLCFLNQKFNRRFSWHHCVSLCIATVIFIDILLRFRAWTGRSLTINVK